MVGGDPFGEAAAAVVDLGVEFFGGGRDLVLVRTLGLFDPVTDATQADLEAAEPVAEGETAITLTGAGGGAISGELPAGLRLTIDAVDYTSAVLASAASGAVQVEISPPLAGPVPAGVAVALAKTVELTFGRLTASIKLTEFDGTAIRSGDVALALSADGATSPPRVKDITADGRTVAAVLPIGDEQAPAGWKVLLGDRGRD